MKILTSQMEAAPTRRPWRVQMACGMISPAQMQVALSLPVWIAF